MMSAASSSFTFVDLCCGIGGNRVAMESLGGRCVYACELDPDARNVYENHFGQQPMPAHDLMEVTSLPPHDIMCAGPPCRSYSRANKGNCRASSDEMSEPDHSTATRLWEHLLRLSTHTQCAMLFESTNTLTSANDKTVYTHLRTRIQQHADKVYDAVLDASDYGVPQIRKRWFCVAFKRSGVTTPFTFPSPTVSTPVPIASILEPTPKIQHVKNRPMTFKSTSSCYNTKAKCIGFINHLNTQNRRVYAVDQPGPCLTTTGAIYVMHEPKTRKQRKTCKFTKRCNDVQLRMLSIRELTAYMGFPNDYHLPEQRVRSTRLLGRAVPPPVIRAIGTSMIKHLGQSLL